MQNQEWQKYEHAYHIRSLKYTKGKGLSFNRKQRGIAEYLKLAAAHCGKSDFAFLDAGCGNGIYLQFISNNFPAAKLFGFDFSETILPIAQENAPAAKIRQGNLEEAPFGTAEFDVVLCTQVIEHLLDNRKGIAELHRMLKPDGYLIISTDNRDNYVTKALNLPIDVLLFPYRLLKSFLPNKEYFPHRDYSKKEFLDLIRTQPLIIEHLSTFRFSAPPPLNRVRFFLQAIDGIEHYTTRKGLLRNYGDIVIALCRKEST